MAIEREDNPPVSNSVVLSLIVSQRTLQYLAARLHFWLAEGEVLDEILQGGKVEVGLRFLLCGR